MSDSSDVDKPIAWRKKKGDVDADLEDDGNLSDYRSENSDDSDTRRAKEEDEIKQHRLQMAKRAAKKEEDKKATLTG